jgi:2-keto-4-pentenoate hydratase/2-oxohepta-3-ene-1,7-dioic acid hydratase in catechol pathway
MSSVKLGDSLVEPTKILCVGRNYLEHIQELNNAIPDQMVVFLKPPSSISGQLRSFHQERLHYEAEI